MGYVTKDEIKAQLDAAGIDYDADATRDELADLLPEEPKQEPKGKTVKMRLLRDYWPEEGERIRKGAVVEMDAEDAMDAMERNFAARVK